VDNAGTFTSVNDPNTPTTGPTTNQLLGVNDNGVAAGFYGSQFKLHGSNAASQQEIAQSL
jgi:hypothetical protein